MAKGTTLHPPLDQELQEIEDLRPLPGGPPPSFPEPPFGPDDSDGQHDHAGPPLHNARLAVLLFLGAEGMFFAGLLSGFVVFRLGSPVWPPPFQPRLPIVVTALNTVILLVSGYSMQQALRAIRRGRRKGLVKGLGVTALLGTVFLSVQGYEWVQLVGFGLTLSSGVYGSTFYTLIGCHGVHVFGAVIWLLIVLALARKDRFSMKNHVGVEVLRTYWYFVVGLWLVLFPLVYLY
ncbi:MAG: cytochrome c oxidase subunit 3 [Candidatus Entotheonellia bacterium]